MEKIVVSPASVRGLGNIVDLKDVDDFILYNGSLELESDTVNGLEQPVFLLEFDGESHDYSLAFSQSSYAASGGSATLSVTLTDNSVAVEGVTVSVTGSDSSSYTCTTNSNGVGTVTVTNVTSETTFTASYSNVTDTCTVTVSSILFQDDCSSNSRLSEYGNYVSLFGTSGKGTLTYNSTENAYSMAKSTTTDAFTGFQIPINTNDNIKVSVKMKLTSTSAYNQFGIAIQETTSKYEFIRVWGNKTVNAFKNSYNSAIIDVSNVASFNTAYYTLEVQYVGDSRVFTIYDANDSQVFTRTFTSQTYSSTAKFYIAMNTNSTNVYIKNIVVETL